MRDTPSESGSLSAKPKRKPGRPKTLEQIREIILKLAGENGWGLTRILGERKKLGLKVGRSTVKRILAEGASIRVRTGAKVPGRSSSPGTPKLFGPAASSR